MAIRDKKVALLIDNEYQELEFWYPYFRLQEEGVKPVVIGNEKTIYRSKLGYEINANECALEVEHEVYDAIIVPGGYAPDKIRTHRAMLNIVAHAHQRGAIIAAICHAAWVLISANILSGKKVTCYHAIKDDVINSGATYIDEAVVMDDNLITSRVPSDLPLFCKRLIERLNE